MSLGQELLGTLSKAHCPQMRFCVGYHTLPAPLHSLACWQALRLWPDAEERLRADIVILMLASPQGVGMHEGFDTLLRLPSICAKGLDVLFLLLPHFALPRILAHKLFATSLFCAKGVNTFLCLPSHILRKGFV